MAVFHPVLVVVCATVCVGIGGGYVQTMHLYTEEIRATFEVNYKYASLVSGVSLALSYLSLICNPLFNFCGPRKSMLLAGFVAAACQVGAYMSSNFVTFTLLLGIFNGMALTIAYNMPLIAMSQLFDGERRYRAMSVVLIGSAIGQTILPPIIRVLLDIYGLRGTLVIMSGISLNIIPAGLVLPGRKPDDKVSRLRDATDDEKIVVEKPKGTWHHFKLLIRTDILQSWKFQVMNIYGVLYAISTAMVSTFAYSIMVTDYGISEFAAVTVTSLGGVGCLLGKCLLLLIPNLDWAPRWWIGCVVGAIQGLDLALLGTMTSSGVVGSAIFVSLFRVCGGMLYSLFAITVTEVFHPTDFPAVFGYNVLIMMMASFVAPVITGWMKDVTNSFKIPLLTEGILSCSSFLIPIVTFRLLWLCHRRQIVTGSQLPAAGDE